MTKRKAKKKINEAECKRALVKEVEKEAIILCKIFLKRKTIDELAPALETKNWKFKRKYKAFYGYEKIWEFICEPFKKELVGYVYTTIDESKIENIIVQTE